VTQRLVASRLLASLHFLQAAPVDAQAQQRERGLAKQLNAATGELDRVKRELEAALKQSSSLSAELQAAQKRQLESPRVGAATCPKPTPAAPSLPRRPTWARRTLAPTSVQPASGHPNRQGAAPHSDCPCLSLLGCG
jgi:hypothetical protein